LLPPSHLINAYEHLLQRIDPKQVEALVAANRESLAPAAQSAVAPAPTSAEPQSPQRHAQHQQATEDKAQGQGNRKRSTSRSTTSPRSTCASRASPTRSTSRAPTS
jgi:hypothetical protein